MGTMVAPILMAEEYWMSSHLSIARFYGGINYGGKEYSIVDKRGMTLIECSVEAEKLGRDKAIEAGEPADLVRNDFITLYKKLGRERFIAILEENNCASDAEIKKIMKGEKK